MLLWPDSSGCWRGMHARSWWMKHHRMKPSPHQPSLAALTAVGEISVNSLRAFAIHLARPLESHYGMPHMWCWISERSARVHDMDHSAFEKNNRNQSYLTMSVSTKNLLFVIVTSLGDVTHEQMKTGEIGRDVVQVKQVLTYRLRIHRFKFL